ncbi:MAG: hypothetical protein PHV13_02485 [Candidatus ainarchaeum sp.]|nr:hypothetical protein [Candidatus ainarchaeum sp.]
MNALEVEHDVQAPSFVESIRRRLPNTRVFREALGLLRQLRDTFENRKVLEVSFYPEPLGRAAAMLDIGMSRSFIRAHEFTRPEVMAEPTARFETLALLQFCHRIPQESLVSAVNEANRLLVDGGTALISLPCDYWRTHVFENQVQDFGFEIKTEGTLMTRTLSLQELRAAGVGDAERVKQKMDQTTNVILLQKTKAALGRRLDAFTPTVTMTGKGEFKPSMGEINTPEGLLRSMSSIFQKRSTALANAFMLTILDDSSYLEMHVIGYDMNVSRPKTTEVWSSPDSKTAQLDIKELSARILNTEFREKALIRPGHETRIPAKLVKAALK